MSHESSRRRKYELKERAEEMAKTHARITEAAIDLHGTVGPSRTTLSAVAKRAGVERRTLYRHFFHRGRPVCGLLDALLQRQPLARSRRLAREFAIRGGARQALDELYAYYERTEPMLGNVLRDAELVDFARDAVAPLKAYLDDAVEILVSGRRARGRRRELLRGAAAARRRLRLGVTLRQRRLSDRIVEAPRHRPGRAGGRP